MRRSGVTRELLQLGNSVANLVCVCDDLFRDVGRYDPMTEGYRRGLAQICRSLASEFDVTGEVLFGKAQSVPGKSAIAGGMEEMRGWIYGFFMTWGMFLSIPCPVRIWDEKARER